VKKNSMQKIYAQMVASKGQVALLLDPEKCIDQNKLIDLLKKAEFAGVHFAFVGGSTATRQEIESTVACIKATSSLPVVLFPGGGHQLSEQADALLYLSLISGRNPDYLIGHHVQSASEVSQLDMEIIPTGYILVDGGTKSSVAYVSQTTPIPRDQFNIAKNTAIAGVLQGKKLLYFDAGSGAKLAVPEKMISDASALNVPLIVGGGIRSIEQLSSMKQAGANIIVIGNHIEENSDFLLDIHHFIQTSI
jgi:phosphoglycerol geranylgeranyltransferase